MRFIESCVKSPVKVSVGVLLVVLFGAIAVSKMPVQLTPEVQTPTLTIETRWFGASPQEVEREIVEAQEEQLKGVEGVQKISSESFDSMGRITLEFAVGTDMQSALIKVNSRLQQVREYPIEADKPVISTANLNDRPIAFFILRPRVKTAEEIAAFQEENPDLSEALEPIKNSRRPALALRRLQLLIEKHPQWAERLSVLLPPPIEISHYRRFAEETVVAAFERVKGVSDAEVMGGRQDELQVIVDPEELASRKLTIDDVRIALNSENKDSSGGDLWENKRRYVIRTLGQFKSPEAVEEVVLSRQGNSTVYVRDVAEVRMGHKKPEGMVRNFGNPALALRVQRETGANVLSVMEGLRKATDALNGQVLKLNDLQLEQVYDETEYINSAVGLVEGNIFQGGLLTLLVLLLFLRSMRSSLVIALAIPISIVATFMAMAILGRSLNVISLAGLAFAVGMLVDNAIVVLENIVLRHQNGEDAYTASIKGGEEVWGAVLISTLTTLAVFVPVIFVQEEVGQLFRDISIAISSAVGFSLIVSITVIPAAAARLLAKSDKQAAGVNASESLLSRLLIPVDRFGKWFVRSIVKLNAVLQRNWKYEVATVLVLVGLSIGLTVLMLPKAEYLPDGNRNLVFGILLPPAGYNLDQMNEMGEIVERRLQPYWDVDPDSPEAAQLDYPVIADFFFSARGRQLFMGVRAVDPMRASQLVKLLQEVAAGFPGTISRANQSSLFERGIGGGRSIDIEITGPDLSKLVAVGRSVLGQIPSVIPNSQAVPRPSLDLSNPEVHVIPKREEAAELGVSASSLGYAVDALVDGARASDYFLGGHKIDLSIIGKKNTARHSQDLEDLPIATRTGDLVPLAGLADVKMGSGPEQINHRERQRAITISVTPPAEMALEDALIRIREQILNPLLEDQTFSTGFYQVNLGGTADYLIEAWRSLRFNLMVALLITYLLMAALFESWVYPIVIIVSVPLGAVGGVFALWTVNQFVALQKLDVLTMLGFVILIGTVVNNPILIVHQALNHIRADGMSWRDAILESVRTRTRPIFMTTLTTVLGLLPLVLVPGAGNELYRGLGAVMLGGLLISTLFTLVLVPCLFHLFLRAGEVLSVRWTGKDPSQIHASMGPTALVEPSNGAAKHAPNGEVVLDNGAAHLADPSREEVP